MILLTLTILATLAVPDDHQPKVAVVEGVVEEVEPHGAYLVGVEEQLYFGAAIHLRIRHESDPFDAPPLRIDDLPGRRIRAIQVPTEYGRKTTVILVGGMNPRRFERLINEARHAVDGLAFPSRPRNRDEAMVLIGLASACYATRECATAVLIRQGEASIPALVLGERSRDAEVRLRSRLALRAILRGEKWEG